MNKLLQRFQLVSIVFTIGLLSLFDTGRADEGDRTIESAVLPVDISRTEFNRKFLHEYPTAPTFKESDVEYLDEFNQAYGFDKAELERLLSQGMVVSERLSASSYGTFFYDIYHQELPVLVTTDAILFALHTSYDTLLADMESTILAPTLVYMLERMQGALCDNVENYSNMGIKKECLEDVDLLITVARFLILRKEAWNTRSKSKPDSEFVARHWEQFDELACEKSRKRVTGVISKIVQFKLKDIKLFNTIRTWNFGEFEPMGHYRESEFLKGYWQTMTWLRMADFDLSLERHRIDVLILIDLLKSVKPYYDQSESVIDLLVGRTDRLTLNELDMFADNLKLFTLRDRLNKQEFIWERLQEEDRFRESVSRRITYGTTSREGESILPITTGMFSSRWCLDSYVIHNVTHDRIAYEGKKIERMLPSGLDIVFTLGNDRAANLLGDELDKYPYYQYLTGLRRKINGFDDTFWTQSYYNLWLGALRGLNASLSDPRYPLAMRSACWQDKMIHTQLIGLTELRHANQLYNPPVYCGTICDFPQVYVEPYPEFYYRLMQLAEKWLILADMLMPPPETKYLKSTVRKLLPARFEYLQNEAAETFQRWRETMRMLEEAAESELAGEAINDEMEAFLKDVMEVGIYRTTGSGAVSIPMYSGWYPKLFYGNPGRCQMFNPLVVAAAFDVKNTRYLEMATGHINGCLVVLEVDGKPTLFVGPVGSYYEFAHRGNVPMTDEEWRMQVARTDYDPDRRSGWSKPFWTGSYNDRPGKLYRPDWTESFVIKSDDVDFLSCDYDRVVDYLPDNVAAELGVGESVWAMILDATGEDSPSFHCQYLGDNPLYLVMPEGTSEGHVEADVVVKDGISRKINITGSSNKRLEELSIDILSDLLFVQGFWKMGEFLKPLSEKPEKSRNRFVTILEHKGRLFSLNHGTPVNEGDFKLKIRFDKAIKSAR